MPKPTQNNSSMLFKMAQEPLLVAPGTENLLTSLIVEMQTHEDYPAAMDVSAATASEDFWDDGSDEFKAWLRPYNVVNGVLVIPVHGVLINKMSIKFGSWATGYTYIERAFERGMADPEVHTIAFDHDSPGGMVAGNFELAEKIAAGRTQKNIKAFANDHSFSASYSLATAASSITMSRSGGVGSVGVVTMHVSYADALEKSGIEVTFIFAGKHKVEGNPYQKLPDAAKARIQARIDRLYGEFVGLVAQNRGMEEQAVRDTEALTYDASDAIEVGFADAIGTLEEELAAHSEAENRSETIMSTKNTPAATSEDSQITQAQMDSAVEAAKAEGYTDGVNAERARIDGILASDEAKTRPAAAKMAIKAGMTIDDAKASLADMPEETAQTSKTEENASAPLGSEPTPFSQNMTGTDVGATPQGTGDDEMSESDQIIAALASQTGLTYGRKSA